MSGEERKQEDFGALQGCFVDGDAEQRARQRKIKRRALALSVAAQSVLLVAVAIAPLFAKPALMVRPDFVPTPVCRFAGSSGDRTPRRQPQQSRLFEHFRLNFSTPNAPVRNSEPAPEPGNPRESIPGLPIEGGVACNPCISIPSSASSPAMPPAETPKIVHMTHLDPALLIRRVQPDYPPLARQTRREGRVELHAIIATDGTIQSLDVISGDALFRQSALEAVRQWRYRPTVLNGLPVQVDTTITVIYTLGQ
jgi:TonB family protein